MKQLTVIAIASSILVAGCATDGSGPGSQSAAERLRNVEWKIEDVGGRGVVDDSHATLRFDSEGRVSGQATCNTMGAAYTISGDKMTISQPVMTMRACAPALMDQEGRLVELLKTVATYRIDETGALILESADGSRIVARR